MNPSSRVLGDVFEQLKSQAQHTGQAIRQEPGQLAQNLLGESEPAPEESGNTTGQQQQQIVRLRQLDEARRQESLKGLRQQQAVMARWDNERKVRETRQQQGQIQEQQQVQAEKQEKHQIKQLRRREKAEALAVKRAQTAVEARLGKF